MPVNAPPEYYKAEERFQAAKSREEKIAALQEMIRLLPKHHGSEAMHAQLRSRLAKIKKSAPAQRSRAEGISKEGEAQVCLVGFPNSGKSTLLNLLTNAGAEVADYEYTTTKPEVGMMDYLGVKVQIVEIPATFDAQYLSIARTADLICVVGDRSVESVLDDNYIRTKRIHASGGDARERIWNALDLMIVYTEKESPMALPRGATVGDFAERVHHDFVQNFRFARVVRGSRVTQAGLSYELKDGDVVELHTS